MLSSKERKERILQQVRIQDILDIKGNSKYSTCPACGKLAKFSIFAGLAKCHSASCEFNKVKNVIECYKWKHNLTGKEGYWEAIKRIELDFNLPTVNATPERSRILESCLDIYQHYLWSDEGKEALAYLKNRGFLTEAIKKYKIGFAPHISCLREFDVSRKELEKEGLMYAGDEYYFNRIILPIRDMRGNLLHFTGRYISNIPKNEKGEDLIPRYKETKTVTNVQGTKSFLAFEDLIINYSKTSDTLVIAEGYFDALSLVQLGIPAVASFGLEKISSHHYKLSKFKNIIFMFDNDTFDKDHLKHPLEYKSWLRIIPQIIELQLALPTLNFYTCMVPNLTKNKKTKDINDWVNIGKLSRESVLNYIELKKKELLINLISKWGSSMDKHISLLQLIKSTERKELLIDLAKYIPPHTSILEYAIDLISS